MVMEELSGVAGRIRVDRLPGNRRRLPLDGAPRSFVWRARLSAVTALPADAFVHASRTRQPFRPWRYVQRTASMSDDSGYGLWSLVIVNSVIFILFAYTFFKPRTGRDWRSFGAFSAFLVS